MRRQICWVEKLEDGVKKDVRISFHNREVLWDIKRSDLPRHEQTSIPTEQDWDELEKRAENWYRRHALPFEILGLIKTERAKAI
jgi:hypothetical protein